MSHRLNIEHIHTIRLFYTTHIPRHSTPQTNRAHSGGIEERIEPALEGADVVMALRLQRERQHSGLIPSVREYCKLYALTTERLALAEPGALVMHPGPMNEGVEIAPDVAHGVQSVIEEQVTNGVAIRMALLYLLSGGTARLDGE